MASRDDEKNSNDRTTTGRKLDGLASWSAHMDGEGI